MRVSPEELINNRLSPETVKLAVDLINVNGYVLFEEVLPRSQVESLNKKFSEILENYMERNQLDPNIGFHDDTNHVGLHLPFVKPFIDEAIIAHPFVTNIVEQILGVDCLLTYFASNTSVPGGKEPQEVHSDTGARFGDRYEANIPITELVVNFPLVDVTEENGPMEVWPGGTHLHPDRWYGPNGHDKSKLAEHMHSFKAYMPAGSIMIRDLRMWHRGTPNSSGQSRTNLALIYTAAAVARHEGSIQIPQETYDQLSDKAKRLLRNEKIGFPVREIE
ncbi:phytanoyl-CoA dioxygenase family protein [Neobacillus niacini]|uniref:phytanoyl-CoA dioxygenase family protein n=1 Tax=Neobacillus niacini TaxID=86668 RepID=UPI003983B583